jgi:hypothetical protein
MVMSEWKQFREELLQDPEVRALYEKRQSELTSDKPTISGDSSEVDSPQEGTAPET